MKIRANIIANFTGQGWSAAVGVVFVPLYIRLLGLEAYALIGFFMMLLAWLPLLDLGMMPTIVREMARFTSGASGVATIRDLLRSMEAVCLAIAILIVAALGLGAPFIATHWLNARELPRETVAAAIATMGVVLALRFWEGVYRSALVGLQRQVALNLIGAVLATVRNGGAALALIAVAPSIAVFFWWQVVVSLAGVVTFGAMVHSSLPRAPRRARASLAALSSVKGFAGGLLGINLLALLLVNADKLILSRLLPLASFGTYMFASTATGALYALMTPITQAAFPAMVADVGAGDAEGLTRRFHSAAQLSVTILAPAALTLILLARPLLVAWSGDAALAGAAAPIVAMLAVGTLFNGLMQMPYYLQLAHGWTSITLKANAAAVIVLVPALLLLVPRYGAVAAAGAWAAVNIFYLLVLLPIIFGRLLPGEQRRWWLRDVAPAFGGAATVLTSAAWLLRDVEWSRAAQGASVVVAGALAFAIAALLTLRGHWPGTKMWFSRNDGVEATR